MRSLVRTSAFARGELVSTLRQPRLLLMLVVGPFLVLFVFGVGYDHSLPDLHTIIVGSEGELTDNVDDYIRAEEPAGIAYEGTTQDEEAALDSLRAGEVDLVVVLPDDPLEELGQDERAVIEVHQRSLDPVTYSQIAIAADLAVAAINDDVISQVIAATQERTEGVDEQVAAIRSDIADIQAAISEDEIALVQRTARQLAPQLDDLAQTLESGASIAGLIGLGGELDETVAALRTGADQLERLADVDAAGQLDEAASTLDEIDEAVAMLRAFDPEIAATPFEAEVISQTPVSVTLERYFAPGLVALMLQHLGVTFAALTLVRERQSGTLDMLQVSPATTSERLAGKALAFLALGGAVAAALTVLALTVFEVPPPGDWVMLVALLALALLASIGIGFLAAALSATDGQAVQFSMLLLLAGIFFSGLFMPLDRIGMPVEVISWLLPVTYAFVGMQDLLLLGEPADGTLFAGLGGITLVTFVVAHQLISRRREAA